MVLRTPLLLGIIIGFTGSLSVSGASAAQAPATSPERPAAVFPVSAVEAVWERLDPTQKHMVDLLAADFFAGNLSADQRGRILANGAKEYRRLDPQAREDMRNARRQAWRELTPEERQRVANGGANAFALLTEKQKAPFRLYAIEQLDIEKPVEETASIRRSAI